MPPALPPTIGLFYGSSTCYTEMAAEKIAKAFAPVPVQVFNIAQEPISNAQGYEHVIFGIPTWDYGELQEDWDSCWPELPSLSLQGKKVALFGLGDQIGYPEWFLDALGYLHAQLVQCGAQLYGEWPIEGYEFTQSQALSSNGSHFVGLALDEENQAHLSQARIEHWCQQLRLAWGL